MTAHPRYSCHRHRAGLYSVCLDRSNLPSQVVFVPETIVSARCSLACFLGLVNHALNPLAHNQAASHNAVTQG